MKIKLKKRKTFKKIFANQKVVSLIQALDKVFTNLPHLPHKLIEILAKIVPWTTLILGIISIIGALSGLFFLILSVVVWDTPLMFENLGSFVLILLNALLLLKAVNPLRKRDAIGWIYLFWGQVMNIGYSVYDIASGNIDQWWWTVLSVLIFTYLLFEIGPNYTYREEESELGEV